MPLDSDKRSRRARRGADDTAALGQQEAAEGGGAAAAAAGSLLRRRPGRLVRLALLAALAVALALALLRAWRVGPAPRQDAALAPGAAAMAASAKGGAFAGASEGAGAGPGAAAGGALRTRAAGAPAAALVHVSFEVFGKVQKVSFRKYAQLEAQRLKLTGFVENTEAKTVRGEVCGPARQVALYQEWLRSKGSPKSRVERVEFGDKRSVSASPFKAFDVAVVLLANGKQWAD